MPAVVKALLAAAAALASDGHPRGGGGPIDRRALVARHNARITCATLDDEECSGLNFQTLGNGAFAFSVDVTGLQARPTPPHPIGDPQSVSPASG